MLLLLAVTMAAYGRILGHDFLSTWDDNLYVVENTAIRTISLENIRTLFSSYYVGNYAPVQMLSYMLDYRLWGLNAAGFLATNLLIHSCNGLLFYWLLWKLYRNRLQAAVAAALFLLHPVQVESVAWISQRKNLLALLFFLLAWHGYCRYREAGKGKIAYATAVIALSMALLAKSVAVVFPLILFLYDLCFPVSGRRLRILDKVPFILVAIAIAAVAMNSQLPGVSEGGGREAAYHGGSALTTLFTMLPVFCRYLGMIAWPVSLSADYYPQIHLTPNAAVIGAALILCITVAVAAWIGKLDRRSGFWTAVFAIGLLPVSQIIPLVTLMNDRYLYFPMLGAAALAGIFAKLLYCRIGEHRRPLYYLFLLLPLIAMAATTYHRTAVWQNDMTLWEDAVAKDPGNSRAWSKSGEAYVKQGNLGEAKKAFESSLELLPDNMSALNGLAAIEIIEQDVVQAEQLLKTLFRVAPDNSPELVKGLGNMGNLYLLRGEYAAAEKMYDKGLAINPDNGDLLMLQGSLAVVRHDLEKARRYYGRAETVKGGNAEIAYQLACIESLAGATDTSLSWLEISLQRGYRNYGNLVNNDELSTVRSSQKFTQLLQQYLPKGMTIPDKPNQTVAPGGHER